MKKLYKVFAAAMIAVMTAALLAGCGSGKTDGTLTAFTVNDEAISTGAANMYLRYQQASNYSVMEQYGMVTPGAEYFDSAYDDQQTYGEFFVSSIKDSLVQLMLIRQHADEYGCTVSEEQQAKITEAAAKFLADNESVAKKLGIAQEDAENILSLYTYASYMEPLMTADVDTTVTQEEAAQTTIIYAGIDIPVEADAAEEGTETSETSATSEAEDTLTAEEALADMNELLEKILQMEDPDVETIQTEATAISDKITVSSRSYGADDTIVEDEIKEIVAGLSDGETYDQVIVTDTTYYIVRLVAALDEEATQTKMASLAQEKLTNAYNELVESWKEEAVITDGEGLSQLTVTDEEVFKTSYGE